MDYSDKTVVGVDTAKRVFQLHWLDRESGELIDLKLSRPKFLKHFANREPCRIGMEACGGAHHWARRFREMGHDVRMLPARSVRPFVKGNKSDVQDARAIWTAMQQPTARPVAVKSEAQQGVLMLHRLRQQQVKQRTAAINCLRGLLTELGEVMPKGRAGLSRNLEAALEQAAACLPEPIVEELREQWARVRRCDEAIRRLEGKLEELCAGDEACRRLLAIPGIGMLTATALMATMGDPQAFRSGREFAAWLGLVPRHTGTGGRTRTLGISKRGDIYVRTLLVHGARAVLACSKEPPAWAVKLRERKPFNVAAVAVANRQARMAWALLAHGRDYDREHAARPPRG